MCQWIQKIYVTEDMGVSQASTASVLVNTSTKEVECSREK